MSSFDSSSSNSDGTTKKLEYLLMLKLASKVHDNERIIIENLQKDYNEYTSAAKTYHRNFSNLCELISQASDRDQIIRSSKLVDDIRSPGLRTDELQTKIDFLERNNDFTKQRDFHCNTKDLPIARTAELVQGWHQKNCRKGVSLSKIQSYVYRLKKGTGRIHKVFVHSNKRLRYSFQQMIELYSKRFDQDYIKYLDL